MSAVKGYVPGPDPLPAAGREEWNFVGFDGRNGPFLTALPSLREACYFLSNPDEQHGSRLVLWVLKHEFSPDGKVENELAQAGDGVRGCGDLVEVTQQERGEAGRMKLPAG
ncbi:MAG: hypothetical protein WCL11_12280 [Verrucomicrobiota bacterium]|nr:hypothetical protein [Verrucomicrobiota bacterium]